ncbi:MAG: PEP-CTERM sorting domain-containing protein [Emcibacter sp.]|nr:PEP-CTERM sorting domain-containing protein [Emcibacter sp.]
MKNIGIKAGLATISLLGFVSLATAGTQLPTSVPEPGTFGMFAGAAAVAIILARIIKKK